jgi:hypothetical protein
MEIIIMKRMLLGLCCVAFAGVAYAQEVIVAHQPAPPSSLQLVSGRIFARDACCNSPCPPVCAKTCAQPCRQSCPNCMVVPTQKIEKHVCYSSVCEKVCFKACPPFLGGNCEQNCANRQYTQKYLVKKVSVQVVDTYKCVPINPSCDTCRAGILHSHQPAPCATVVETIPTKPMPPVKK